MKKLTAYQRFEERCKKELRFHFSKEGEELQLCLVAQGYEYRLAYRWCVLLGSGFLALEIINSLKEEINNNED